MLWFKKKKVPRRFEVPTEHVLHLCELWDAVDDGKNNHIARLNFWSFVAELFPQSMDGSKRWRLTHENGLRIFLEVVD